MPSRARTEQRVRREPCGRRTPGSAAAGDAASVRQNGATPSRAFRGSDAVRDGALGRWELGGPAYPRLLHAVYAPAGLVRDHALVCEAAGLVLPASAQLTGASAATVLGHDWLRRTDDVEVVMPDGVQHPARGGVRLRRARHPLDPGRPWRTTQLASPERVAFDAAARVPLARAVARLDALARRGDLDLEELGRWLHGRRDHGVTRVRRALSLVDARAESLPESELRVLLVEAGVPVAVQHVVRGAGGGFVARVDLAVVAAKVAILYDGAWHALRQQLEKDRAQLNALHAAGWEAVHVTAADLADPGRVVALVRAAVARRA